MKDLIFYFNNQYEEVRRSDLHEKEIDKYHDWEKAERVYNCCRFFEDYMSLKKNISMKKLHES